jgi:hypothetical protein
MIDNKSIQRSLQQQSHYKGAIDGTLGPATFAGINSALQALGVNYRGWNGNRKLVAYQQSMMRAAGLEVGAIDGLKGPQTLFALERWQDKLRDIPAPSVPLYSTARKWPTQREVPRFYGAVGKSQVRLTPPYQFYLYDTKQKVNSISVHSKVHDAALRVFQKVLEAYGPKEIHRLHLDRFFGSLAVRKMRGGSQWSMHSWGIAFDFDASRNQLRWGRDKAAFGRPEYKKWFEAWESEGAISLLRERNYDGMHTQFARL